MSLGNQRACLHFGALDGPVGGFLGITGALSGKRRENPQDRLNSFLLERAPPGSEPGPAEPKLIALGHLKPLLLLVSLSLEVKENNRDGFLSILFMLFCDQPRSILSSS